MSKVYFVSTDGTTKGCSSHFFSTQNSADKVCNTQNERAVKLDIKARYAVVTIDRKELSSDTKIRS